jgi:branched-chain amino acid transport system ATP-binding protein
VADVLTVRQLSKTFGGITAVDGLDFEVQEGAIYALIGPNGAGKTTVINLVTGLYRPTGGEIRFGGDSLGGRTPAEIAHLGISRTFQNIRLFHSLTVLQNVLVAQHRPSPATLLGALFHTPGFHHEEARIRVEAQQTLQFLGLWNHRDRVVKNLPYGEQRLVEIARALVRRPRLLLLDEPAAGLIRPEVEQLMESIRSIHAQGITILLIEHNMDLVMRISQQILVMDFGKRVAEGPPDVIRQHPKVIEAYLGRRPQHARHQ